jgi:hypothetical protein
MNSPRKVAPWRAMYRSRCRPRWKARRAIRACRATARTWSWRKARPTGRRRCSVRCGRRNTTRRAALWRASSCPAGGYRADPDQVRKHGGHHGNAYNGGAGTSWDGADEAGSESSYTVQRTGQCPQSGKAAGGFCPEAVVCSRTRLRASAAVQGGSKDDQSSSHAAAGLGPRGAIKRNRSAPAVPQNMAGPRSKLIRCALMRPGRRPGGPFATRPWGALFSIGSAPFAA